MVRGEQLFRTKREGCEDDQAPGCSGAGGPAERCGYLVSLMARLPSARALPFQNVSVSVSPTAIDYATLTFETTGASPGDVFSPYITATNNGNVNEDLKVRGANATLTGGSWTIR